MLTPISLPEAPPAKVPRNDALWSAAQSLEATFLSEMLKSAGVGAPRDSFGGGAGEASFAGFLTNEFAASLAESGGIGLAESIYKSLVQQEDTS